MIKKKCLLLINNNQDDQYFIDQLKVLAGKKNFSLAVSDDYNRISKATDFVFCINYRKIIPADLIALVRNGIYVFHSSDLPRGRGWAPLYYSLVDPNKKHVLTMLKINEQVDDGEIMAKAYFQKRAGENADSLREVDNVMTMKIISRTINDLLKHKLSGKKQRGRGSFRARRRPQDSQVRPGDSLRKIQAHCLAVTAAHPAFYVNQGQKYIITIRPERLAEFNSREIKIVKFYKTV